MSPFHIYQGNVLEVLKALADSSVHCVVTSPPYYGLRNYSIPPTVWGGSPTCSHEWGDYEFRKGSRAWDGRCTNRTAAVNGQGRVDEHHQEQRPNDSKQAGQSCRKCGSWLGCLGLEPNIEMFVGHIVDIFREVRRVLHPTGVLWINFGDSFIAQPHGAGHTFDPKYGGRNRAEGYTANRLGGRESGLKNKDLVMMPARVALALQADGWYLRQQIPWVKSAGMPESCPDRPGSQVEYIFLLSKNEDYFYDRTAVMVPKAEHERTRLLREQANGLDTQYSIRRDDETHGQQRPGKNGVAHSVKARQELAQVGLRGRRNNDWFYDSFRGLLVDPEGEPLAMLVNPQPFQYERCQACEVIYDKRAYNRLPRELVSRKAICTCGEINWQSHFATFAEALVEPMIKAGTSEVGACEHCGAPWVRVLDKRNRGDLAGDQDLKAQGIKSRWPAEPIEAQKTLGWKSTCPGHPLFPAPIPVPCVVLDPFCGSGTTGVVAVRLGRHFRGVELNTGYIAIAQRRFADSRAGTLEEANPA